jgi:cell division septal protein FtsQ
LPSPSGVDLPGALRALVPSVRSLLLAAAVVTVAASAYLAARSTSVFAVRAVEIEGASPRVAAQVEQALAPVRGRSLLRLRHRDVVARVTAVPEIASARYDRAFPRTLAVVVTPERPLVVLRRGAEAWLVSERSRVIRRVERGQLPRLPRIWAPKRTKVALGAFLAGSAADAVAPLLAAGATAPALPIRSSASARGSLTLKLGTGLELRLGERRDLRLKLAVAARIVPSLVAPRLGGPSYLDLSVTERPVAGTTLNSNVRVQDSPLAGTQLSVDTVADDA